MAKAEKVEKNKVVELAMRAKTTQQEHQQGYSNKPEPQLCKKCNKKIKAKHYKNIGWKFPSCDCKDEFKEEQVAYEKEQQQKRLQSLFNQSRLGKRFKKRNFKNFKVNDDNRKHYKTSKDFAINFQDRLEDGKGQIFVGDYGTGKTHLAAAILQEVLKEGYTGVFISIPELLIKIRSTWGDNNDGKSEIELINGLIKADLVVMDDLGVENTKDWVRERLYVIINSRYEKLLPTIFTTNCTYGELSKKVGGRIESRLWEMCEFSQFEGNDYRKKGLKG